MFIILNASKACAYALISFPAPALPMPTGLQPGAGIILSNLRSRLPRLVTGSRKIGRSLVSFFQNHKREKQAFQPEE